MKKVKGMNDPECRNLAKAYLTCRMDKFVFPTYHRIRLGTTADNGRSNLMAKDEFKNLGFPDEEAKDGKGDGKGGNKEIQW